MDIALDDGGRLTGAPDGADEPAVRVAVSARLEALRGLYLAGDESAALEAVLTVVAARELPLGGGYRHAWPEVPAAWARQDIAGLRALWSGVRGAADGAERLRRAGSAGDVSAGLRRLLGAVQDAARGAALLGEVL